MREIKFRVWNGQEYFYSGYFISQQGEVRQFTDMALCIGYEKEQFTGLHDKNGTEIYEGDIMNGRYHNLTIYTNENSAVEMSLGSDSDGYNHEIWYGWKCGRSSLADLNESCEVIGNIHENAGLLNEQ